MLFRSVVTAASLKLFPRMRSRATAMVGLESPEHAVRLLMRAKAETGGGVDAFELMGRQGVDFVLAHIPDTREPLPARHRWYVLMELASGEPGAAEAAMATRARLEAQKLRKFLSFLDTTYSAAPLVGLLGTIVGMMSTFRVVAQHLAKDPNADTSSVTAGIGERLDALRLVDNHVHGFWLWDPQRRDFENRLNEANKIGRAHV